jgi:hypothetical protein
MRKSLAIFVCLAAIHAVGQGGPQTRVLHGSGDPRTQSPIPDCTFDKQYIDDQTGFIYTATGYRPCTWSPATNGSNGNVTASPQFSLFYQPNSGSSATAQGDSAITTDGAGTVTGVGLKAKTIGGTRVAAQWQTGGGNNGITNSQAANQYIVADPGYANTERGFGPTYFSATPMHYEDQRLGATINYWHNPFGSSANGYVSQFNWGQYTLGIAYAGRSDFCLYDVFPSVGSSSVGCNIMGLSSNFPGYSLGPVVGGTGTQGWTTSVERVTQNVIRSAGIAEADAIWQNKYGVGDNYGRYTYVRGRNGSVSGADEATGGQATSVTEEQHFVAACSTGCTSGSTSIKTNGGAGLQGQGQYVIDTTASAGVVTGHVTATANGITGNNSNALTVDMALTPSTAWGTINNTDLAGVNAVLTAPYGTSKTFNVTIVGGTQFNTTEVMCFSSIFHEQVIPTAVGTPSGGVQSVTAVIRKPHIGEYVAQGGDGCKAGEDTGTTSLASNYGPYLFEVFAVTGTNTIQAFQFQLGQHVALPYSFQTVSMSNATASSGTTVTAVVTGSTLGGGTPWQYNTVPYALSGSSDSALNATCTNVQWQTKTQFTCTIAGLVGTHTTTTAMTATLVPPSIKIQRMAETLDVQNESLSPPQVDGTLVLEPNEIAFATNDSVTQTNHISGRWMGAKANVTMNDPYAYLNGGNFTIAGKGATAGGPGATTNSILSLTNQEPPSSYIGYGGSLGTPPNAINISGPYGYGLEFGQGPWNGGSLIDMITDSTQVANPTYSFNILHVGGFSLGFTPNTGAVSMTTNGGPFTFGNVLGGTNFSSQQGASNSALQLTGQPFSGGTGTTTYPYFYINPSASGTPSDWNTNGTWLGIQTRGASSADFANWKNNSVTKFKVDSNGTVTAPTITATATVNSVDVAASGTVTAANVTASSTVTAVNVSASGTIAGGGACRTGAPAGSVCSNGQMLSGSTAGIIVAGDSIGAGTGATPASPNTNGFMPVVANAIGGPYPPTFPVSGDQCADQNYNVVFSTLNPLGAFQDPAFLHELGTNDITRYTTTTNQQQIFQRCVLANLSWAAIPFANKKFGQNGTLAGGFAVDATATQLQAGLGASCTTLSCTATYTITTPVANGPVYLWYLAKDSNGGTFTVKVDGVFQNDPFNGTTTWNNSGDGGALISTTNGGTKFVAAARLPTTGIAGSSHTILITGTSATSASNIVEVYGIGTAPLPSTANPVAVAVSPNPQNNANTALVATYSAFVSSQVTTVAADGLNVYFADTGSALLNISTLVTLPYTLTATTQAIPGWVSDTSVTYAGTPGQALTLVGSSPAQGQYSVSAGTYTINAADEGRPLLIKANVNCGSNSVTTLAANCMVDTIHPNNEGHAVMASVIFTTIPTGYKNGALAHPAAVRTVSAPIMPTNPNQFWTPNPYGLNSGTAWNPGISLTNVNGYSSGLSYQANTGNTLYFPNNGGTAAVSFCPTIGGGGKQNIGAPPTLASCYFTLQANGAATFTVPTSLSRLTITATGHTGAIALPTSAIAAGACTAGGTLASGGDGVSSTTAVAWSYNADPTAVTGYGPLITGTSGGLSVVVWTTSVTINTKVCNNNTVSITPGALSINVRALL